MRCLTWATTETTFGVLPRQDLVDRSIAARYITSAYYYFGEDNPPLLVGRIQSYLQHTECLERPEEQPRLARVLACVPFREALN
jgi:hypothetical protein